MRESEFRAWLTDVYVSQNGGRLSGKTIVTQAATCRRIEAAERDLDTHFRNDQMAALISRFEYSKQDLKEGKPLRHNISLARAEPYSNTAFFRRAVHLYRLFCEAPACEQSVRLESPSVAQSRPYAQLARPPVQKDQPRWTPPSDTHLLQFARLVTPYIRFLRPGIVDAIVEDDERRRGQWASRLAAAGIDPGLYLWDRCATVFPGIRRRGGAEQSRQHRRLGDDEAIQRHAFWLDDNRYPRMTLSLAIRGNKSSLRTPGFQLAHLADHKKSGNRIEQEAHGDLVSADRARLRAFGVPGLFTSAANVVFVPHALLKPTDAPGPLRRLLQRKAQALYTTCRLLPAPLTPSPTESPNWDTNAFDWAEPAGDPANLPALLEFRAREIEGLFRSGEAGPGWQ